MILVILGQSNDWNNYEVGHMLLGKFVKSNQLKYHYTISVNV